MDADLVRLILLVLGASLVAGIWIWDRRKRRQEEEGWEDEPDPVEDADEILGLRPVKKATEVLPVASTTEGEPVDLPRIELEQAAEAVPDIEAPPEPEPVQAREAEPAPMRVERTPAWAQQGEPMIPAFVMQAGKAAVESEATASEPLPAKPSAPKPEPQPRTAPANLEAESELAWMPDSNMSTEFTPPLRDDSEPVMHPESDFVPDDGDEPELPVLELSPEPIEAPKSRKTRKKKKEEAAEADRPDPLSIRMDEDQFDLELGFSAVDDQDLAEAAANLPELIVQINVVAKRGQPFTGEQILAAMDQVEMKAGEHDIFHRYDNRLRDKNNGKHKVLFSLASLVEPGNFPVRKMKDFSTPGLTLFTQLPGPRDGLVVYSDMLYVAERLARLLDAKLKDESRSALTKQTIEHTRSRIAEHKRQITLKLRESNQHTKGRR